MAKIRQFWLVVPLDIKEDGTKIGATVGGLQDFAQEVDGLGRRRPAAQPALPAEGYGFGIGSSDLKRMKQAFTTKAAADAFAKNQAELQPKTLFGVFGCLGTYETTTPTVIQKQFNEDGELTPAKETPTGATEVVL
jgi:hypothetical protein